MATKYRDMETGQLVQETNDDLEEISSESLTVVQIAIGCVGKIIFFILPRAFKIACYFAVIMAVFTLICWFIKIDSVVAWTGFLDRVSEIISAIIHFLGKFYPAVLTSVKGMMNHG